jgi:intracellular multiplication protein IcmL
MNENEQLSNDEKLKLIISKKANLRVMSSDGTPQSSEVILEANWWYRTLAKWCLIVAVSLSGVLIVSIIALYTVATRPPITLGYSIDSDGTIVELQPIGIPSMTNAQVLSWASQRARDIHKLSFVDWQDHVDEMRQHFTSEAHVNYQYALKQSDVFDSVVQNNQVSWAEPISAPQLVESGLENGAWTWIVKMNLNLYIGGGDLPTTATEVEPTMRIKRVSRANNLSGVVVTQYLTRTR